MNVLAVIPARGGSKGVPRKNVRPIGGIPLIAHTIRQARATPAITRIVVSTDDDEIAGVATSWGSDVIMRPAAISGDTASSESALVHVLDTLRASESYEPDLVVFLQATSPLRAAHDITNAIATLEREGADSLFSSTRIEGFVWRSLPDGSGLSALSFDFHNRPRRQDAPEDLIENGSIYVFRPWVLRELGNRLGGRIATYRMSPLDSMQIDEPRDLEVIERLYASAADAGAPDLSAVRLLVLDFDGVLTDNRVWVDQDGRESVACHRGDGWGIGKLRQAGVEVMILSTEENPVVAARARKLRIGCVQGCGDKGAALREAMVQRGLTPDQVAFVGNDENDLDCLSLAGMPIAVADAAPVARRRARYVTRAPGGYGAVREVAEWILATSAPAPHDAGAGTGVG